MFYQTLSVARQGRLYNSRWILLLVAARFSVKAAPINSRKKKLLAQKHSRFDARPRDTVHRETRSNRENYSAAQQVAVSFERWSSKNPSVASCNVNPSDSVGINSETQRIVKNAKWPII